VGPPQVNPVHRPSADELLHSDWLREGKEGLARPASTEEKEIENTLTKAMSFDAATLPEVGYDAEVSSRVVPSRVRHKDIELMTHVQLEPNQAANVPFLTLCYMNESWSHFTQTWAEPWTMSHFTDDKGEPLEAPPSLSRHEMSPSSDGLEGVPLKEDACRSLAKREPRPGGRKPPRRRTWCRARTWTRSRGTPGRGIGS
jgi:hypothetical protein